ncbi:MAG: HAMP domain-containing protein [Acutalibacteraceae bacterium]
MGEAKNVKKQAKEIRPKKENFLKVKEFFQDPKVGYAILGIVVLITSFLLQYFISTPKTGTFLASDMDLLGNVYILGVDEDKDRYKITKIKSDGSKEFSIDLENSKENTLVSYSNLEVDSKGNFYVVKRQKNTNVSVPDESYYPIKNEIVMMYDTNGAYVKQVVSFDLSKDSNPPTNSYVQKIQLVDTDMTVITKNKDRYDVIKASPLEDSSPQKINSFEVTPEDGYTNTNDGWVLDSCVLSTGRVFYSTPNGKLWGMDNKGTFVEYSNAVSSKFLISGMYVDNMDDIYFTDSIAGGFYKLDTKSITSREIYGLESTINESSSIKLKDVRKIKVLSQNDFYAPSKDFVNPYYVRFGTENKLVSDIHEKIIPWGFIYTLIIAAVILAVIYLIRYLSRREITRVSLGVKIGLMFIPVLIIGLGILVVINTKDSINEYMSVLRSEQERGAKTIVDAIDGNSFSKINPVTDYMSKDYVSLKNSVDKGYNDLLTKIGDKSDYIVVYTEKYNKIYALLNSKYSTESSSYKTLNYTDPDMVSSDCVLVDSVLERDEVESLYDIWDKFSSKSLTVDSQEETFRDVYGDISGSFVAIKDNSGTVVGFVGNYLDENIHSTREFYEILKHSIAVIVVIAALLIAYVCFVIRWCLRPLKKIENGINKISKGEWNTRIKLNSRDEFADIASAFNIMSDKIDRYTSNLIRLNKEYIRYVPAEIFRFMNKEKITQVDLFDNNNVNLSMIYITFNLSKNSEELGNESTIFKYLKDVYTEIFKVVKDNGGVIQSFDSLDCVALFSTDPQDAFNASVQLREINIPEKIKNFMNITVGYDSALIGILGTDDRRGAVIVSDEIMKMFNIDSHMKTIGVNHIATKEIIDNLSDKSVYDYRYIGKISNISIGGCTEVYEIIDSSNKYKHDLYISTNKIFEKAVNLYITAEFEEARKMFTNVLRVNENDKVAVHYLTKCDEYISKQKDKKDKSLNFSGFLI